MATNDSVFRALPVPVELLVDDAFRRYQSPQFSSGGVAHLRGLVDDRHEGAVVTELGLGPSITNPALSRIWHRHLGV